MSGRLWRWLLVGFVILLALYSAYPPVRVRLKRMRAVERVAATPEEAEEHEVDVGDTWVVEKQEDSGVGLPLARGERSDETSITWQQEDLTVLREETSYAQGRIKLGLDMAGGTELLCELKPKSGQALSGKLACLGRDWRRAPRLWRVRVSVAARRPWCTRPTRNRASLQFFLFKPTSSKNFYLCLRPRVSA